ncbi:PP2C family protein-serine/threonine phosphatase [Streptomyces sp. NPDC006186]|uniref:PP2C family protein-serine/threonine phosphatase n=1 Tax=Streptomyces sp. NPDC006186 TaxID=3155248 RepID=UPI0033A34F92
MIPSQGAPAGADDAGIGSAWLDAPCPVVVLDAAGGVVDANRAAHPLLSLVAETGLPPWLAHAHTGRAPGTPAGPRAAPSGWIGDRYYEAHATPTAGGHVVWWLLDGTDHRLTRTALRTAEDRASVLAEVSSMLLSSLNVPRCSEVAARMAAEHLADAAVLVAPPQGHRHLLTQAVRGAEVTRGLRQIDPHEVPGLAEALQGFPPVPARWIDPADLPPWVLPPGFPGEVGSVIVTPLPGHGVPAGALILLRSTPHQGFSVGEEVFARLFAARAGAALSAARLYTEQSAVTATLMRDLLPPRLSHVHGVDYAGAYRPAKDHELVGGDFYDVHPGADADAETFVVLGDVAGKGLEAAVLTGKIRNTLQALQPLADDHSRVLTLLNGALLSAHQTRFATLVLASVRRHGDRVRLRLTSAGHLPPLVVRADGTVETADTHGMLVGALPDVHARTTETELAPGETCLLYTDGITEARGGPLGDEMFGEERLVEALTECGGLPGEAIVERVQMLAAQWLADGGHDDMAAVAISAPRTFRRDSGDRGAESPRQPRSGTTG